MTRRGLEIEHVRVIDELLAGQLAALDAAIFAKPLSEGVFVRELGGRRNLCVLIGSEHHSIVLEKRLGAPAPAPAPLGFSVAPTGGG